MKIVSIQEHTFHRVDTDSGSYRRAGPHGWEVWEEMSWKRVHGHLGEDLERAFQKEMVKRDPTKLLAIISKIEDANYLDEASAHAIHRIIKEELGELE